MIKTQYALCAIRVIRDADENRISVIDLLENMTVPSLPVIIPRLSLVWALTRDQGDPEEFQGRVVLRLNQEVLIDTQQQVNFQGAFSTRAMLVIGGVTLQTPGEFSVEWTIEGIAAARYSLTVASQPHVAQSGEAPSPKIIS